MIYCIEWDSSLFIERCEKYAGMCDIECDRSVFMIRGPHRSSFYHPIIMEAPSARIIIRNEAMKKPVTVKITDGIRSHRRIQAIAGVP
jgi:hypothetical protein